MGEEEKFPMPEQPGLPARENKPRKVGVGLAVLITCLSVVAAILLTWTFTSLSAQNRRLSDLENLRAYYDGILAGRKNQDGDDLAVLNEMIRRYSLYADSLNRDAMIEAAFKAYVEATGDIYARYYTAEEYAELTAENNGDFCGIGVTVVQSTATLDGAELMVYRVIEVYEDSPALGAGIHAGDMIYAVKTDGAWKTIGELGFDKALLAMRGEEGSEVEIQTLREESGTLRRMDPLTLRRKKLTTHSVRWEFLQTAAGEDRTVGVIHISGFDMTTPTQFKDAMNGLIAGGAEHFVFDVRNNPGGDLQSITAVLSYFLNDGDKVIDAIDKDKNVVATYSVGARELTGNYEGCSVKAEEIGMYRDRDFVVLCNGNTASAAEVFVATLRDYRNETDPAKHKPFRAGNIIGTKTFGKGIMQTTRPIPFADGTVAYLKLTTHAYVTECGISYHGEGIQPDATVELSEEAKKQPLSALKHSEDAQLQAAVAMFR